MKIGDRIHGLISISLFDLAIVIGIYIIANENILWAGLYTLTVFFGMGVVIYSFCTKCISKDNCSHIFFGPITRILPKRKPGPYTNTDYFITVVALLIILIIPQFWLWKYAVAPFIFWGLLAIAGIEVYKFVCSRCNNTACAMCRKNELFDTMKCG